MLHTLLLLLLTLMRLVLVVNAAACCVVSPMQVGCAHYAGRSRHGVRHRRLLLISQAFNEHAEEARQMGCY